LLVFIGNEFVDECHVALSFLRSEGPERLAQGHSIAFTKFPPTFR
jgi:hypothetical protein